MRRRSRPGGEPAKTRRRKTASLKRRNTPKDARRCSSSAAGRETEVARFKRERDEALEQQKAATEVLRVISSSPGELEPVFKAMLANAMRICEAHFGNLLLVDDEGFRSAAFHNYPDAYIELYKGGVLRPGPHTGLGRILATKRVVHIIDLMADSDYAARDPLRVMAVEILKARTFLAVPMLKDGALIGAIVIYRQEVRAFTDKQIELLTNFAAQAVIAIENTRLLSELRQRTDDLTESLEQQKATSEVLKVISSSPGDLEPVFQAMLENATRICEARFATLWLAESEGLRAVAVHNAPPAFAEARRQSVVPAGQNTAVSRVITSKEVEQVEDLAKDPAYTQRDPLRVALVELVGARTLVCVPMLKEDELVGAISIYRQEVRLFTGKQIELVKNFAAQAVIAIENTRLLNELRESLQQQTATADVLKVISSSPGELEPVFQSMLENATRLSEAKFAMLSLYEDNQFRSVGTWNLPPAWAEFRGKNPIRFDPMIPMGRAVMTKQPVHIADVLADQAYIERYPGMVGLVELGGARTLLQVPMLKENEVVGTIGIYRQEVRPFTDKQIELVKNFAAQAVIAIENTRLLNELRQRTTDLTESLEQQTATADVLRIISSSPGELQPVFNALLENATRICGANFGGLFRYEAEAFHNVATHKLPAALDEFLRSGPIHPGPDSGLARVVRTHSTIHIRDTRELEGYAKGDPIIKVGADSGGIRTLLTVPMLKDDTLIGVISIYRQEVRPFTDKQIELVTNFAAQAVIAIENTRLLNELRQSLEQQTATADVLRVISSSPGELEPVFQAMLENATRICEARFGVMFRYDGEAYEFAAEVGTPPALAEFVRQRGRFLPGPNTQLHRVLATKAVSHTDDYAALAPDAPPARLGGARSTVDVPMFKDGVLVGVISIYRQEVRPFTDKQIELVQNFAAQAVIAIENTRLLNELRQSLQQQTATSDVLKVISRSAFDLQSVFNTLVESAASLCEAYDSIIFLRQGERLHVGAHYGPVPMDISDWPISPGWVTGRAFLDRAPVHTYDLQASAHEFPDGSEMALRMGTRTILAVPLLRADEAIGALNVRRTEVKPFTDKQIELLSTFADQAVIAIENVRLFEAEQQRTHELSESLEQQTATAEVLRIISSSPGELEPVFDAMLENATRICQAQFGMLNLYDGNAFRNVALHNPPPQFAKRLGEIIRPHPESGLAQVARTRQIAHIEDLRAGQPYLDGDKAVVDVADLGGARTVLLVPMLSEGKLIGAISIYRQEVRPFTDKQIALV